MCFCAKQVIFFRCIFNKYYIQHTYMIYISGRVPKVQNTCRRNLLFSFILNKVFVAVRKHNTKKNIFLFCTLATHLPTLNSRVKKALNSFLSYVLLRQLKTLNKIYEKIYCSVSFTKTSIKILHAH